MTEDLRYPIGQFTYTGPVSFAAKGKLIDNIAAVPQEMRKAVSGLDAEQMSTPYRPGGWTLRQVVHHVPDSHMNAYIRFRLAMTEECPTIKPYREDLWAELSDSRSENLEMSLKLLEAIHERWVVFLRSLTETDYARAFNHPELGTVTLEKNIALYDWHGRHHIGQITSLRKRRGW